MSHILKYIKCGARLERPNRHPRPTCNECKRKNQLRLNLEAKGRRENHTIDRQDHEAIIKQ